MKFRFQMCYNVKNKSKGDDLLANDVKFDRKKYEEFYETLDDRNKVILYLLSKNKVKIDDLCQIKVSDVNEKGVKDVELPRREQGALARYLKGSKMIESIDDPLFPSRSKSDRFLTPHKLKISFSRLCTNAGVEPAEVGVTLSSSNKSIQEEDVNMDMILNIIQEKVNKN